MLAAPTHMQAKYIYIYIFKGAHVHPQAQMIAESPKHTNTDAGTAL